MKRKRATPAPAFRQPQPFNPITGQFSKIGPSGGVLSYCAMMQVIEEDTHDDYLVCRGFDPHTQKFYSSLPVAKPYGLRGQFPYEVAQVFPAIKARTAMGRTPGVSSKTVGHPADLSEELEILYDDSGVAVEFLLLDSAAESNRAQYVEIAANTDFSYGQLIEGATIVDWWPDGSRDPDPGSEGVDVINTIYYGVEDTLGLAACLRDGTFLAVAMDCQSTPET